MPHPEMSRKQAEESYEHLMAARPERRQQLSSLLAGDDVDLDSSDEGLRRLAEWFGKNIEADPADPERLRNLWYAVVNDVALFLGDTAVSRAPTLRWGLFLAGKRDVAFQKHVVVGFTKVANPKYNLDIDRLVAMHGHRLISGAEPDPEFFVSVVRSAQDKA